MSNNNNIPTPPMGKAMPLPDFMFTDTHRDGYQVYDVSREIKYGDNFEDNTPVTKKVVSQGTELKRKQRRQRAEEERKKAQELEDLKKNLWMRETNIILDRAEPGKFFDCAFNPDNIHEYDKTMLNILRKEYSKVITNEYDALFINYHLYCSQMTVPNDMSFIHPYGVMEKIFNKFFAGFPPMFDAGTTFPPKISFYNNDEDVARFTTSSTIFMKIYKNPEYVLTGDKQMIKNQINIDQSLSGRYFDCYDTLCRFEDTKTLLNKYFTDKDKAFTNLIDVSLGTIKIPRIKVLNLMIPIDLFYPMVNIKDIAVYDNIGFHRPLGEDQHAELIVYCLFDTDSKDIKEKVFNDNLKNLYQTNGNTLSIIKNYDKVNSIEAHLTLGQDKLLLSSNEIMNLANNQVPHLLRFFSSVQVISNPKKKEE